MKRSGVKKAGLLRYYFQSVLLEWKCSRYLISHQSWICSCDHEPSVKFNPQGNEGRNHAVAGERSGGGAKANFLKIISQPLFLFVCFKNLLNFTQRLRFSTHTALCEGLFFGDEYLQMLILCLLLSHRVRNVFFFSFRFLNITFSTKN